MNVVEVAARIIELLDPGRKKNPSPHVVICWDESHCLVERRPGANQQWNTFSELRRALRTLRDSSFISIFLSTAGKFHDFSPSRTNEASERLQRDEFKMLPPITEVNFDLFAEKVDCIGEEWSLARIASTHQIVHLGRAL